MEQMPDVATNITALDKITSIMSLAREAPQFFYTVRNWYDVLLFYNGLKKSFILRFRNGYRVRIRKLEDLLRVMDKGAVQEELIKSFKIPAKIMRNRVEFDFRDRKLYFYYGTEKQLLEALAAIKGMYLGDEYGWLRVKNKLVVDIGAHIADTAMYFASRGARHVYCFEPYPHSYSIAKKNIEGNGFDDKITIYNTACGRRRGSIILDPRYTSTGGDDLKRFRKGKKVGIETLKDIVQRIGQGSAVLKLDCEGYEYGILLNSSDETLQRFDQITMEYHYGYINLEKRLREAGFYVRHSGPRKTINCYANRWKMTSGLIFAEKSKK